MPDREKIIRALEICQKKDCALCPYTDWCSEYEDYYFDCTKMLAKDVLELLKEQQEQIDKLIEESASNAEMAEGYAELLNEQEPVKPYFVNTHYEQHFKCGNCDYVVGTQFKYCCKCGKRILWDRSEQADSGANEKRIRSRRKKRYPANKTQKEGQETYEDA